jgi:16S rRNA (guanine1516-N2)-methyltransferase
MTTLAVTWEDERAGALRVKAEALAERLGLPLQSPGCLSAHLALVVTSERLDLREVGSRRTAPVCVEFAAGIGDRGRKHPDGGRELLIRALGTRPGGLSVVDATAGLARDSFQLARAGCRVTVVERSPILGALIEDGMERALASNHTWILRSIERMRMIPCDARDHLRGLSDSERPDMVLLDPMYPTRSKTALVKKEMRICRAIVGDDEDAPELLEIARCAALRRVLVKRHRHAVPLAANPDVTFRGRVIRFDVYLTRG